MRKEGSFSKWLDAQLAQSGLSGKDLAVKIGVSEATISRIRNGRAPLSPRLKAKLSTALNAQISEMPVVRQPEPSVRGSLKTIQHSIPDHAVVNYALNQGMFLNQGIQVEEVTDRESGAQYPQSYFSAIRENLSRGYNVLAAGPRLEFERNGLMPTESVFSHSYRGYHLITRASALVSSVDDAPLHQRLYALKLLLEQLENAEIWADGFSRISWQSSIDLRFLRALRSLSYELTGIPLHIDEMPTKFENKAGLEHLHMFGKQGVDFVLTDAGTLAEAYSHPECYKVLLSLDTLEKTIKSISREAPAAALNHLKKLYRSDNAAVAVERFKMRWLEELAQVEVPVYWNLFCPDTSGDYDHKLLAEGVANALNELQQTLATPHLRRDAINDIKNYCEARAYKATGKAHAESFFLAWDCCYEGL